MGFPVSLRVDHEDIPEEAVDVVFAWLHEVDARFSPFRPHSEVPRQDRGELSAPTAMPRGWFRPIARTREVFLTGS